MLDEVKVRKRKSAKHGKTYEYRFEIAQVGGERKWISKGGFLTEKEAKKAGLEAWKRYCVGGKPGLADQRHHQTQTMRHREGRRPLPLGSGGAKNRKTACVHCSTSDSAVH